ncbi:MAG: GDSL-type esterase/lipase family protein [Candidatus Omnitrophota bacterium]
MFNKRNKTLFIAGGFLAAIIILEILLQLYSFIIVEKENSTRPDLLNKAGLCRILCLGDSYTYGIGAGFKYSYPAQLQRQLDQNYPESHFKVINAGLPGINTPILSQEIQNKLKMYDPDIVIVMIGVNDQWNFEGFLSLENPGTRILNKYFKWSKAFKLIKISTQNFKKNPLMYVSQEKGTKLNKNYKYHDYVFMKANLLRQEKQFEQANQYYNWLEKENLDNSSVYLEKARCYRQMLKHQNIDLSTSWRNETIVKTNKYLTKTILRLLDKTSFSGKLTPEMAQEIIELNNFLVSILTSLINNYYFEKNKQVKQYLQDEITWVNEFIYRLIRYDRIKVYTPEQQAEKLLEVSRIFNKITKKEFEDKNKHPHAYLDKIKLLKEASLFGLSKEILQKEIISITRDLRQNSFYYESLILLDKALKLQCDEKEVWDELDEVFIDWGQPDKTIGYYLYLRESYPLKEQIYLRLGRTYKMLKDYVRAKKYFKQVLEINSQNQEAIESVRTAEFFVDNSLSVDSAEQITETEINDFINSFKIRINAQAEDLNQGKNKANKLKSEEQRKAEKNENIINDCVDAQALTIIGKDDPHTLNYVDNAQQLNEIAFNMLENIFLRCQDKGVVLFFLGYPGETPEYVVNAAQKYNIPFLDSRKVFLKIITPENIKDYFVQDGHCTAEGYGIIAQVVFDKICELQKSQTDTAVMEKITK